MKNSKGPVEGGECGGRGHFASIREGSAGGFSLLEVLVALAILGIGVVSLIQLFSASLRTAKRAEDYSTALIYARSLMDEAVSMPDIADVPGVFTLKDGFSAERKTRELSKEDKTSLYEISVSVKWPAGSMDIKGRKAVHEKER